MPVHVEDLSTLQQYSNGVMLRAGHHAGKVQEVILTLIGSIVVFKDANTHLEVLAQDGDMKNALWVMLGGVRYAFSYDHQAEQIVMKERHRRGQVVARFDNTTTAAELLTLFIGVTQAVEQPVAASTLSS